MYAGGISILSFSSFHSLVVGANRPVGQFLTRILAEQNLSYKGLGLEQRERLGVMGQGRPFFILTPSLFHSEDYQHIPYWLEQARDQDVPVIMLSSLAVFSGPSDDVWKEDDEAYSDKPLAQDLLTLENMVREHTRHIILRTGQGFSLMADDFASRLLTQIRDEQTLTVDMQRRFSPTPADDVADVLLAILKQVACCDDLWGTYHFCGVEPASSYAFAEALLAEAGQYENLSDVELSSQEGSTMPAIWVPQGDTTRLFYTFGIKPKPWRKGLSRLVRRYYRAESEPL
ncbi:MAG: hypothetical protein CMI03_16275 [Oceanospirillaceae bacterium]|nr:hypothetical protein [Oceanospirillaceae bacterium]MBS54297.1 hypothetical protein [Oceanospirillaceae bacterium]